MKLTSTRLITAYRDIEGRLLTSVRSKDWSKSMTIYDPHLRLDVVVHGYWGNARLVNDGTSDGRVIHCHNVMAQI